MEFETNRAELNGLLDLNQILVAGADIKEFLNELVLLMARVLGEDDPVMCSVTLERTRHPRTVAASSAEALTLDELQYEFEDGPCLSAMREGRVIAVEDLAKEDRWTEYRTVAVRSGLRSALAVPMPLEGTAQAVLNCYSFQSGVFDEQVQAKARFQAGMTSKVLDVAIRLSQYADRAANLEAALESRTTIDLAVGIVMAQNECSQDEAFDILRRASSGRNMKLRDVATQIVEKFNTQPARTHFNR